MDTCKEQLVKKKWEAFDFLCAAGIFIALPVVCFIFYVLLSMMNLHFLALFAFVGLAYLAYRIFIRLSIEYEYTFVNGDLSIDIIYAQQSRKRILNFHVRSIDVLEKYIPEKYANRTFDKKIFAGAAHTPDVLWCIEFTDDVEGKSLLLFSPSDELLKAVRPFVKQSIARDVLKEYK